MSKGHLEYYCRIVLSEGMQYPLMGQILDLKMLELRYT